MRTLAGAGSAVEFTHLSRAAGTSLANTFTANDHSGQHELAEGRCHQIGVLELMKERGVKLEEVCLLDPKSEAELAPEDGEKFSWYLFGVRSVHP
jgi:ribosome biogenesis SPOUT family RNA methylase Rps3